MESVADRRMEHISDLVQHSINGMVHPCIKDLIGSSTGNGMSSLNLPATVIGKRAFSSLCQQVTRLDHSALQAKAGTLARRELINRAVPTHCNLTSDAQSPVNFRSGSQEASQAGVAHSFIVYK